MYNRYQGNTGRRERFPEPGDAPRLPEQRPEPPEPERPHPGPEAHPEPRPEHPRPEPPRPYPEPPEHWLRGLLRRLAPGALETEDLLILAILWLLYRESGDRELLLTLGAYLFF